MLSDLQYVEAAGKVLVGENSQLAVFKEWFTHAVEAAQEWREIAKEDMDFYVGHQWANSDRDNLEKHGKPAITINRIKPLLNVLSGYQRLNRYDIEFLPRTNSDSELAAVRKGVTKYILDSCHYNQEESDVFFDGVCTGLGWFEVGYKFDWDKFDGDAFVRRESAMNIYVDPESRDKYYRDKKYLIRARWVDKDELKNIYPEHAEEIEAQMQAYMTEESEYTGSNNRLWYDKEFKKIRFAECWYKKVVQKRITILRDGSVVDAVTPEMIASGMIAATQEIPSTEIRLICFFDNVILEDKPSPYKHGEIPFVPFFCYYQGDDDIPAGIIRDLKDPQREVNKRRSQEMHILNTQANGGWIAEEGALTNEQKNKFINGATKPGALLEVGMGALTQGKLQPLVSQGVSPSVTNATAEAMAELPAISGINEALMGTDISNLESGRAIELKQKQAITHIASLFDNLRYAKKKIAQLLWGSRNAPGIIPQFYTEEKTYRIVGENGEQQFIVVNQQVQQRNPATMQVITSTLNDLSQGEFDIVISDTPATATQRTAQFWSLIDAAGKLGLQGPMILDILIDLSDIPQKEEIKRRLQQQQEQQAQAQQQQMQMQLEIEKQKKLSRSMAYKDLQLPLQLQLAAEAGIFPKEYADAFMQWSVQQMAAGMGITQAQQMPIMQQQPQMIMPQAAQPQQPVTQSRMNGLVGTNRPIL